MSRKIIWLAVAVVFSLAFASPAAAAAPETGTVYEGHSVPGLALGDTRAVADASYGIPERCEDVSWGAGQLGLDASCRYPVDGGGTVTVGFRAADGGPAQSAPGDVVSSIRWNTAVSRWTTTAGINTALAIDDPDAVIAAYPDAEVITNPLFGNIERITDYRLGIDIDYIYEFYVGRVFVSMAISEPREPPPPPPPPEQVVHVWTVGLIGTKTNGDRQVSAHVGVRDQTGYGAPGATVTATWTLPKGATIEVEGTTDAAGWVLFRLSDVKNGWFTLDVDDVVLDDHRFDRDASVLSGTTRVK